MRRKKIASVNIFPRNTARTQRHADLFVACNVSGTARLRLSQWTKVSDPSWLSTSPYSPSEAAWRRAFIRRSARLECFETEEIWAPAEDSSG
ncbi:unnamed protein product [Lampetra fluviatilis]